MSEGKNALDYRVGHVLGEICLPLVHISTNIWPYLENKITQVEIAEQVQTLARYFSCWPKSLKEIQLVGKEIKSRKNCDINLSIVVDL